MNTNLKPVSQYDVSGNLIARYPSIAVAAFLSEVQPAHIGKVAAGLRTTAGGYTWKTNSRFTRKLTATNPGILQIDVENDDDLLAVYSDVETASLMSGLTEVQIARVLAGVQATIDGYTFSIAG